MFNTFNMGVGMVAVVPRRAGGQGRAHAAAAGEDAYVLGEIAAGDGVELW